MARRSRLGAWWLLLATWVAACRPGVGAPSERPTRPAAEVIAAHADSMMAIPGVVGLAESRAANGDTILVVMLAERSRAALARLPKWLEGYRVTVQVTGTFRPM